MKVSDPEKDLDQLFQDLVGGQARVKSGPSLKRFLGQKFEKAGLDKMIQTDIRVKVPISERELEVPYGYQNGRFNLIQLAGFQATNPEQAKITACRYAVEGESLFENADPPPREPPVGPRGQVRLPAIGEPIRRRADPQTTPCPSLRRHRG